MSIVTTNTYDWWSDTGKKISNYLELEWNATPIGNKYLITWILKAKGDSNWYNTLHKVELNIAGENRFYSNDVSTRVYDSVEISRGEFYTSEGEKSIELKGGFYSTNIINISGNGTMNLQPLAPTIERIDLVSNTASSITIKVVTGVVSATEFMFKINNGNYITSKTNIYTFEGLQANSSYNITVKAYGNGSWGNEKTNKFSTDKKSEIISFGEFNQNGCNIELNGSGNIVVLIGGEEIVRRNDIPNGKYNLVLTEEEKNEIYRAIGMDSSIECVIRIESGGAYNDYKKSITLTGDVFSCKILINGIVKKGKVWVGTSNGNKQGLFIIGTNNGNRRGI